MVRWGEPPAVAQTCWLRATRPSTVRSSPNSGTSGSPISVAASTPGALRMPSVRPSGAALRKAFVPTSPPAPLMLVTAISAPSRASTNGSSSRERRSYPPPGE